MKRLKSVIAGLTMFTACATHAAPSDESTIIRVTGSTAFRSQAHSAIVALFDSPPQAAYSTGSLSGAGQTFFYGLIGGEKYIITCSWAGSVGGIQAVTNGLAVNFLSDTLADSGTLGVAGENASGGTAIGSAGTNAKIPDVTMSDTYQSATPFKAPTLADQIVGVVGFKWVTNRGTESVVTNVTSTAATPTVTVADASGLAVGMTVRGTSIPQTLRIQSINGNTVTLTGSTAAVNAITAGTDVAATFVTPSPITNINAQQAQALYTSGITSLAQFTGRAADASVKVYATGRDPDSGTRLTAFAETHVGVNATVTQYRLTASGGVASAVVPFPAATINGITYTVGNMGESSGGTLANYFSNITSNVSEGGSSGPAYLIGYLGASDATTAINAGGRELTYNGVAYSEDAIKEGFYTFWCYEHVMYPATWNSAAPGSAEAKKKTVIDTYVNKIKLDFAPIKIGDMKCSRSADGGVVYHD